MTVKNNYTCIIVRKRTSRNHTGGGGWGGGNLGRCTTYQTYEPLDGVKFSSNLTIIDRFHIFQFFSKTFQKFHKTWRFTWKFLFFGFSNFTKFSIKNSKNPEHPRRGRPSKKKVPNRTRQINSTIGQLRGNGLNRPGTASKPQKTSFSSNFPGSQNCLGWDPHNAYRAVHWSKSCCFFCAHTWGARFPDSYDLLTSPIGKPLGSSMVHTSQIFDPTSRSRDKFFGHFLKDSWQHINNYWVETQFYFPIIFHREHDAHGS